MIQIGYYGKTIHRGDFVRFNLPQSLISVVDDWLQQLLILGETTHADNWPAIYTASPTYRFYLSPDIAGANAWFGTWVAGTDKVGRRFPFVIAAGVPADNVLPWNHPALTQCQRRLQELSHQSLTPEADFDAFQDVLQDIATEFTEAIRNDTVSVTGAGPGAPDSSNADTQLLINMPLSNLNNDAARRDVASAMLLDTVLKQTFFCYSLWTSMAASGELTGTALVSGLPTEAAGLALFQQNWDAAGATLINSHFAATLPAMAAVAAMADTAPEVAVPAAGIAHAAAPALSRDAEATTLELDPAEIETIATSEDWLALEQIESPPLASAEPITPAVEPLELDDDVTSAPWESQ